MPRRGGGAAPRRHRTDAAGFSQSRFWAKRGLATPRLVAARCGDASRTTRARAGSAARNIVRKGGTGGGARKEGTAGHKFADASMDGVAPVDPGDPNYEDPNDPERVSSKDA